MAGEFIGGERVQDWSEVNRQVGSQLKSLISRAARLGEDTLSANGVYVVTDGDDERVASMGPELAYVDPQEGVSYYAQLINGVEPAVYMSMSRLAKEEGEHDELILETKVGASWGDADVANDLLEQFESAISKAEQPQQSRGGRMASLLKGFRKLQDDVLKGLGYVMQEIDMQDAKVARRLGRD